MRSGTRDRAYGHVFAFHGCAVDNTKSNIPLAADIPLFTEILQKAGYEVAILGKVHTRNGVEERNWDYYFGHNNPGNDYANPFFKEGRKGKVGPQKQYHSGISRRSDDGSCDLVDR